METKITQDQFELDKVFSLRYQVYVEEENKFGGPDNVSNKKIHDEFDAKNNTVNLLMTDNGQPIGTVRYTVNTSSDEALPCDKHYDFSAVKNEHKNLIAANIGMLAIKKIYRGPRAFNSLMVTLGQQLLNTHNDYYLFTLNHECSTLFSRFMGAKKLNDKVWVPEIGNYIIPMIMYKEQVLIAVKKFGPRNTVHYAVC